MIERRRASANIAGRFASVVMPSGPEPASQIDHVIDVDGGRIRVRVHTPHGAGPFPLYVFIHGGGWCAGTLDERDPRCRMISAGARCVVASRTPRAHHEDAPGTPWGHLGDNPSTSREQHTNTTSTTGAHA